MSTRNLLARTPPMGWNSFDNFCCAITEKQVKQQADAMAKLLAPYGWKYFVIDAGWYGGPGTPVGETMDEYGRYWPSPEWFPSAANGAGLKPLADYVHGLGLRFGLHIMRGIPRTAVEKNLPILGSSQRAADIANKNSVCQWSPQMWGLDMSKAGSRAYYTSLVQLYAQWDIDFIKMDDMVGALLPGQTQAPYYAEEAEAIEQAVKAVGRPIVLSISPGDFTEPSFSARMSEHTEMARISADFWDRWIDIKRQFNQCHLWSPFIGNGFWPDADMLPLGRIGGGHEEAPKGHGPEHETLLTPTEQRTLMTLWCMARSPLILGGNMTELRPDTLALLTNPEVLEVNQASCNNRQLFRYGDTIAWIADVMSGPDKYLAVFNASDEGPQEIEIPLSSLGAHGPCYLRDLWTRTDLGPVEGSFRPKVPAHGCMLYRVRP